MNTKFYRSFILPVLGISLTVNTAMAQWTTNGNNINNTNTGNVGINTATPISRLSVYSGATGPSTRDFANSITVGVASANTTNKYLGQFGFASYDPDFLAPKIVAFIGAEAIESYISDNNSGANLKFFTTAKGTSSPAERMVISSAGYVGIGTNAPTERLAINSGASAPTSRDLNNSITVGTKNANYTNKYLGQFGFVSEDEDFSSSKMVAYISGEAAETYTDNTKTASVMRFFTGSAGGTNPVERMVINQNGFVGIGTPTPTEPLSVKGKIRAQEIKVELTGWADYVFAKDYKLPTLEETEAHIKEKGHLPDIPSAAEVAENGVELGEMNKKLLQKIEELTLHLIEMKKDAEEQRAITSQLIERQQKMISDQQADIKYLKSKIH